MPLTRRFHYQQGTSNKYYEIARLDGPTGPRNTNVITRWGKIGTAGQIQIKTFQNQWTANRYVTDKVSEKIRKGYLEVDNPSDAWLETLSNVQPISTVDKKADNSIEEEDDKIKLPPHWKKIKEELLPGEIAVYEKHNDARTKERRKTIAKYYKDLVLEEQNSKDLQSAHKAAWIMARFVALKYLISTLPYKPAVNEAGNAAVTKLKKQLENLSMEEKSALDIGLKSVTPPGKALSPKQMKKGVDKFLEILTTEIKEKEKIGPGGVSRKRAKMLARKLKVKEAKGE